MRLPDSLMPLRDRSFAWYFSGRFISTIGSVMAPVALTFAVLDLTGSPSALGQVLAARSIPLVIFLLVGGVVADRFSRSTVMQLSHLLSAASQGLVAALLLTGVAQLWMVIALEAINGTVSAFTFPAIQGVVPLVVPRSHIQQANAMLGFTRNGLSVLGPDDRRTDRGHRRLGLGDRGRRTHLAGGGGVYGQAEAAGGDQGSAGQRPINVARPH